MWDFLVMMLVVAISWSSMIVCYKLGYSRGRSDLADGIAREKVEIVPEFVQEDNRTYGNILKK